MSRAKTPAEIAAEVSRAVDEAKKAAKAKTETETESPVNINNGTLTGGQHVTNVTINGDYIPGNKQGKK